MRCFLSLLLLCLGLLSAPAANAADPPGFTLTIKDHRFEPTELQVPAGQKIEIHVVNQDASAEEFESNDLHREKLVPAGGRITLYVGPLKPGSYEFFGDFNPRTARGTIIAR